MATEERLQKLERELAAAKRGNRRLWVAVALAGLALPGVIVTLLWMGRETPGPARAATEERGAPNASAIIRARQFVLEDAQGRTRAVLGMDKDGPRLSLYDERSQRRVALAMGKDGPGLGLRDQNGNLRAGLAALGPGSGLGLFDENGKPRVSLRVAKDGSGLILYDENSRRIWQTP